MKVLVDTSVWSLALRRKNVNDSCEIVRELSQLISDSMVVMVGPVRQEVLSGISREEVFADLKTKLEPFDDLIITTYDYERAAEFNNICRRNGVQGSHTDFLICAIACNHDLLIYTTDDDFTQYAKLLPIHLYRGR